MKVNVLAYQGCLGAEIFGFADSLLIAQRLAQATSTRDFKPFATRLIGVDRGTVRIANDVRIELQPPHRRPDLLVVSGFEFERTAQIRPACERCARRRITSLPSFAGARPSLQSASAPSCWPKPAC